MQDNNNVVIDNQKEKPSKLRVVLRLMVFIIILSILALIGKYFYLKYIDKSGEQEVVIPEEEQEKDYNEEVILNYLGAADDAEESVMLNYFVSKSDYMNYTKEIIYYYATTNNMFETLPTDICEGSRCLIISSENALKILAIYNFDNDVNKYFITNDNKPAGLLKVDYDLTDNYMFIYKDNLSKRKDNIVRTEHNFDYNLQEDGIKVIDSQKIYYENNEDLYSIMNVIYYFKTFSETVYYLDSVYIAK